jgi:cytoskeletal protein CcmA (bactofilin family)
MKSFSLRRAPATRPGAHGCSILAAGITVVGDIETDGIVHIDGRLEGSIRRAGSVVIGVDATVQGNVNAGEVVVGGTVQGNIDATDRVELQTTAVVTGDIEANAVLIHEGGSVRGRMCVRTREATKSRRGAAAPTPLALTAPATNGAQ